MTEKIEAAEKALDEVARYARDGRVSYDPDSTGGPLEWLGMAYSAAVDAVTAKVGDVEIARLLTC